MTTMSSAFLKVGLTDDPDWSSPAEDEPPADRRIAVDWYLVGPTMQTLAGEALKFGVTFRDADGAEKAGTFSADVLQLHSPQVSASAAHAAARPAWKKIGTIADHPSSEALVLDVGGVGTIALRLHSITAADATYVAVDLQQWGAG